MRTLVLFTVVAIGCSSPSESTPVDTGVTAEDAARDTELPAVDSMVTPETSSDSGSDTTAACGCSAYTDPVSLGNIGGTAVSELSGLAVSRAHPGVLWAHNDSGDTPRIYGIADDGAFLGEVTIGGATAVDWEDMTLGPCPSGTCLYIGDIGDNGMSRTNLALYRVPEPNVEKMPFATLTADAEKFPFAYPDGRWNAEALLIHPKTGELLIVTKGTTPGIYRFPTPLTPGVAATLVRVGTPSGLDGIVTGGDISPCGDRALLRTYSGLFEYAITATAGEAFTMMPTKVPVHSEPQGEAVAYRRDGSGYLTASEGSRVPLYGTSCR